MIGRIITSWFFVTLAPLTLGAVLLGDLTNMVELEVVVTTRDVLAATMFAITFFILGMQMGLKIASRIYLPLLQAAKIIIRELREEYKCHTNTQQ
jgi:hypothetical protein